jgi:hypothetical protein
MWGGFRGVRKVGKAVMADTSGGRVAPLPVLKWECDLSL